MSPRQKLLLLENHHDFSILRQTELLGVSRSTVYYVPRVNAEDENWMRMIDEIYTACPFYGSRRIKAILEGRGHRIGRHHIRRLMELMGIEAIYPKPKTTWPDLKHKKYPYLLKGLQVHRPNQVWSTDITYIPLLKGFLYLVAIIDWFSRYVLSFRLSMTMENYFCIEALEESLRQAVPEIFNSDQGSQFTSNEFTAILEGKKIKISMDSKGRALDNIFVERLWRSVKYEEVYLKNYESPLEAYESLKQYFQFYNHTRPHQSLGYQTPAQIHFKK